MDTDDLVAAVADVCWKACAYGQTEDGDVAAYLVPKGALHRLVGIGQSFGSVALRVDAPDPMTAEDIVVQRDQLDRLWGAAQRVLNRSNSADDTWVEVPKSTLDELGVALDFCRPARHETRQVEVSFNGGPWNGETTQVERVVGPLFAVGHQVGNHYWLDSKSDPPAYYWDGTDWELAAHPTEGGES